MLSAPNYAPNARNLAPSRSQQAGATSQASRRSTGEEETFLRISHLWSRLRRELKQLPPGGNSEWPRDVDRFHKALEARCLAVNGAAGKYFRPPVPTPALAVPEQRRRRHSSVSVSSGTVSHAPKLFADVPKRPRPAGVETHVSRPESRTEPAAAQPPPVSSEPPRATARASAPASSGGLGGPGSSRSGPIRLKLKDPAPRGSRDVSLGLSIGMKQYNDFYRTREPIIQNGRCLVPVLLPRNLVEVRKYPPLKEVDLPPRMESAPPLSTSRRPLIAFDSDDDLLEPVTAAVPPTSPERPTEKSSTSRPSSVVSVTNKKSTKKKNDKTKEAKKFNHD